MGTRFSFKIPATCFASPRSKRRAMPQSELSWRGVGIILIWSPAPISTFSARMAWVVE